MSQPVSDPRLPAESFWQRLNRTAVPLFHRYANWLVSISWKRFVVLSLLLMILSGMLSDLPPLSWTWSEVLEDMPGTAATAPRHPTPPAATPPAPPTPPAVPAVPAMPAPTASAASAGPGVAVADGAGGNAVVISIDEHGVRVGPRPSTPASGSASASGSAPLVISDGSDTVEIRLPEAARDALRDAVRAATAAARGDAGDARKLADEAQRSATRARDQASAAASGNDNGDESPHADDGDEESTPASHPVRRIRTLRIGEGLPQLAFFFIVASAMLKASYKGRIQAEVKAAAATETAESEQLKRQVLEARMAAMQAQVEPHFLFNTLASIDHLIETDPVRASQMQKNLIALLRASMPSMRESRPTAHNLGREMAVIRPYLEILKVRMEDRLQTEIQVPDGLLSADFPPMMIQSLVENAIKHGLEPKPDGGLLSVRAEVVHGQLSVTVADTGLGFGKAPTAGTGIGLTNIRERLQLLYGGKASMTVADNIPCGTRVTLTVPYQAQTPKGPDA